MHTHCLITSNMNAFLAATNHNTNMKHFLPPLHTLCVFSSASLLWRYYFYCSLALLAHKILPSVTMKILSTLAQCVWLRCQNQRNNWTQRAELNSNAGKKIVHFCSEHFAKWIIIFIWFLRLKCTHKNDTPTIPLLRFRALLHSRFQYNTPFFLWWCEFANCTYVCVSAFECILQCQSSTFTFVRWYEKQGIISSPLFSLCLAFHHADLWNRQQPRKKYHQRQLNVRLFVCECSVI